MNKHSVLEASFKKFTKNLNKWLPEGIIQVDLLLLHHFGLLNPEDTKPKHKENDSLTRYFNVIESEEKITLINDKFVVWIVPESNNSTPITYVFIAENINNSLKLELGFATTGVYNTSRMVLRILEEFLLEIQENEEMLQALKNTHDDK